MAEVETVVSVDSVRAAADLVDLPLSDDHLTEATELLNAWIPAAIELSRRMQQVADLAPITSFNATAGVRREDVGL